MRRCLAACLALCMMLSLASCKKKNPEPDPNNASSSSSAPEVHIDTDADGPGDEGFYTPSGSTEMTPDDITPVQRAPETWTEYIAEHPETGEGHSFPGAVLPDSENWELYAISGKGDVKYPLAGPKNNSPAYDRSVTKTAARGLNVELEKADVSAQFEVRLMEGKPLGELMAEDWEEDFAPNFQQQKSYDGHQNDTLRSYMQDGTGVFYGENTYRVPNSHSFMRRLNLSMYIDYGGNTNVRIALEENTIGNSVEELDAWEGEIRVMADAIMAQYGKPGLEDTALGATAMIADFLPN